MDALMHAGRNAAGSGITLWRVAYIDEAGNHVEKILMANSAIEAASHVRRSAPVRAHSFHTSVYAGH